MTVPVAFLPFSIVATLQSGLTVYNGASFGYIPFGKHTSIGGGGFLINLLPPGILGIQYGSGCINEKSSS